MIISVSRRTDIPAYYGAWFLGRLKEGYALAPQPFRPSRPRRVDLGPDQVTALVFWTKNPGPMLNHLDELADYAYYFHFTLTPYGPDLEPGLPSKSVLTDTFRRLADRLGPRRVIWRYDPIILGPAWSPQAHLEAFGRLARTLQGHTTKAVISFLTRYPKLKKALAPLNLADPGPEEQRALAQSLAAIAAEHGLGLESCASPLDLGLAPTACIDGDLIESLTGRALGTGRDPGQRPHCRCRPSLDVGSYDSCLTGCRYCYAGRGLEAARRNFARHDPHSPLLVGWPAPADLLPKEPRLW